MTRLFIQPHLPWHTRNTRCLSVTHERHAIQLCQCRLSQMHLLQASSRKPCRPGMSYATSTSEADTTRPKALVIGGGLAGLSVSYGLLEKGYHVDIYDSTLPAQGGASAASAGLCHPFTPRLTKAYLADEAMAMSKQMLDMVARLEDELWPESSAPSRSDPANAWMNEPVFKSMGILRLARNSEHADLYRKGVEAFPSELEWLDQNQVCGLFLQGVQSPDQQFDQKPLDSNLPSSSPSPHPGVFMRQGLVVNMPKYLTLLWKLCERSRRAQWFVQAVDRSNIDSIIQEVNPDAVVVTTGAAVKTISPELQALPVRSCRGQNIHYIREDNSSSSKYKLNFALISDKYVVPTCTEYICGATFEYPASQSSNDVAKLYQPADLKVAEAKLNPFISQNLFQPVSEMKPLRLTVGVRALPPRSHLGSVPLVGRVGRFWYITGLGSRGLLHHRLLGHKLAQAIAANDESLLPSDLLRRPRPTEFNEDAQ